MTIRTKTSRIFAGSYKVTSPERSGRAVEVFKVHYPNDGDYWIAAPDFDNNTSDPLHTKKEAVQSAAYMLEHY